MDREQGVRARSPRSIEIDFYYLGQRCREVIKIPPTKPNLLHARRKRETILYAVHFPDSRRAATLGKLTNKTVGEALEDFLHNTRRSYEASTLRGYKSAIYHHLIPSFGKILLHKLTTKDIKDWINGLAISGKRINNVLIPLRIVLGDAYMDGLIDSNPADRVKNIPHRYDEPNPFKPDEMRLILENCDLQSRNLFQFAFWSGLRTSELIALEWRDIDSSFCTRSIRASERIHICDRRSDFSQPENKHTVGN